MDGVADGKFATYLKCMQRPLDTPPLFNQISLLQAWTKALFYLGEAVWAELPVERVTQGLRACQQLP